MAFNAADYTDTQGKAIPWYSQTSNVALPDAAKARTVAGVTNAAPIQSQTEAAAAKTAGTTTAATTSTAPVTVDGGINPIAMAAKTGSSTAAKAGSSTAAKAGSSSTAKAGSSSTAAVKTAPNTAETMAKLYKSVLKRAPDTAGADYWAKKFGDSVSKDEVLEFIAAAQPEILTKKGIATTTTSGGGTTTSGGGTTTSGGGTTTTSGGGNITSDVTNLYNTILGRDPTKTGDEAGLAYWVNKFGDTLDQNEVLEFAAAAANELKGQDKSWTESSEYTSMQSQLSKLQAAYDKLAAGQGGTSDGGVVTDGGLVDTGSSGASGVVYGPDGTMYSSAAAALAAGVTNYTTTKPAIQGAGTATAGDSQGFIIPSNQTGNTTPGGFISGARQQMFTMPTGAQLPTGVDNPFIV